MANATTPPIIKVIETREVSYTKKSALFGLIKWNVKLNARHLHNDLVIILRTPINTIYIDNFGRNLEWDLLEYQNLKS